MGNTCQCPEWCQGEEVCVDYLKTHNLKREDLCRDCRALLDEYLKNQVSLEASKETDEHKVELMMDAHLKTLQAMKEKYMEVEGYRHELGMKAREDMMKKQMEMDEHRTNLELQTRYHDEEMKVQDHQRLLEQMEKESELERQKAQQQNEREQIRLQSQTLKTISEMSATISKMSSRSPKNSAYDARLDKMLDIMKTLSIK